MSGTNGVVMGDDLAVRHLSSQLAKARNDAAAKEGTITRLSLSLGEVRRAFAGEREKVANCKQAIEEHKAENATLAAELATVQAECCRLTDVNGDLGAAHERLMGAALSVLRSGIIDSDGAKVVVAAYWFDRLVKAVNGDLIDPPCSRLTEAIKRLEAAFSASSRMTVYDEVVSDVLEAWGDKGEDTTATPQPAEAGVNARLLAAAKGVSDSSHGELRDGNYGTGWTGVRDDILEELEVAIREAEAAEPDVACVNDGQIIREQSERIKTLEAVEAAAREIRAEYATIPRDGWRMHAAYNALDFALDGLPKGGEAAPCQAAKHEVWIDEWDHENNRPKVAGGADAPCNQPAPCAAPCQAQAPCPERVHMLAVAARNLIVANRQGRLTQCEINTLDFALDGLI